ncbi:tRNA (adenosine(37)-N6)-threonylcarbamoyltransferase complex transferase subunit TsaD [Marixanthomonas spongiae]|uniref:tRNA N6-adenosine threonylcarbamoyltransferase n=1 Tax=Marixanthomonas spongiae TaxID=2174845 RepID=A0A2U0HWI5_9FLAO|nr:tRNA (adenosine(37)-N6)-threonylcarbamoyltransferase complex transferase subunit TsaD [Marixanthomonas spongiae]PVW13231.1 tRNA (adenosine(37)-N6)-threonylcarbamoyltransferase complex transferase subunit TsaD [Marixanthomonas spongiae]
MTEKNCYILGIESSCDDTAAAVINNGVVLSNVVATQQIHEEYGGVVPELASRAHQQNIVPVVHQALRKANIDKKQLSAIAFTRGPGLMGSLLVGTSFSKSLAMGLGIPLIDVNHMQAHILAHFIKVEEQNTPNFPFLALTISGGHTQIVKVTDYFDMEIIGQTIDDAVGEAFDKSAKILGLPYPGGPLIDKYAQQGDPKKFKFTKPKVQPMDFSFSGLKTAVLYFVEKEVDKNADFISENIEDICASLQFTIVDYLMDKLKNAVKHTGITEIAIGGGVSANSGIRNALKEAETKYGWTTHIPKFEYCTDNAAMIAIVGELKYKQQRFAKNDVLAQARMKL